MEVSAEIKTDFKFKQMWPTVVDTTPLFLVNKKSGVVYFRLKYTQFPAAFFVSSHPLLVIFNYCSYTFIDYSYL
jgi:hypothetical protein